MIVSRKRWEKGALPRVKALHTSPRHTKRSSSPASPSARAASAASLMRLSISEGSGAVGAVEME